MSRSIFENKSEMKLFSLLAVAAVQAKQVTVFDAAEINADCVPGDAACKDENAECVVPQTRGGEKVFFFKNPFYRYKSNPDKSLWKRLLNKSFFGKSVPLWLKRDNNL